MRWWPKPMRIVPTTIWPCLPGFFIGTAPGTFPAFDVTISFGTKGDFDSSSGTATCETLWLPTFIQLRTTVFARATFTRLFHMGLDDLQLLGPEDRADIEFALGPLPECGHTLKHLSLWPSGQLRCRIDGPDELFDGAMMNLVDRAQIEAMKAMRSVVSLGECCSTRTPPHRLREEFGAAAFKAQARIILDRVRYCLRGNRAAAVRRAKQQQRWQCRRAHAECFGRPRGHYSLQHRRP